MQFYPADWRSNAKLRRCTFAERGVWLEVMCLMHDADEYGVVRWPLRDIAQAVGCKASDLQSLRSKGVLKGADAGETCAAYIHVGYHSRQALPPVTLIPEQPGPVWYSSRMARDEYFRRVRGASTRFSNERQPDRSPDVSPSRSPSHAPIRRQGDGASSSSSDIKQAQASPAHATVWNLGVTLLTGQGVTEPTARQFLGSLCRQWDETHVADAVQAAVGKADPRAYMRGCLKSIPQRGAKAELKVAM